MLELKKPAIAGTLESSDLQIVLRPNPQKGIEINLQSVVQAQFGDSILQTVRAVLADFSVSDALVDINDKGALDRVIRARMQTVICRAAEISYDWTREDHHES